jgi:hypothetical protein
MSPSMVRQRLSNLLSRVGAFAFMQSYQDGVKQAVGGIALAMASIALMIKLVHFGALRQHRLGR